MQKSTNLKKDIGLLIATALVTGNMMGSGIFMLPATLAKQSGPGATMLAWLITGLGSIFLALSFAKLGSRIPKTGGPTEFGRLAFGDFGGFMNTWLYWNGSWIGNAAIIIAIASYAGSIFPILSQNHLVGFIVTSGILWAFTMINILGVKVAGKVQTSITIFELCLFLFFIAAAALHFKPENILPMFPSGKGLSTTPAAAASTLWAFIGLETASVAAGEIKNPGKNVKRSTILGILIATIMYMAINFFAIGAMPQDTLAKSTAPIADILSQYFGSGITQLITVGAIISILGTTVGWLLATGRAAYAAGMDGTFPPIFAKVHPRFKTPHASLIISSVLANILLLTNYTKSFSAVFSFMILLATLAYLPVYASTAAAEILLISKRGEKVNIFTFIKNSFVPLIGFAYAAWAVYGSGPEAVMWGFILMLAGVPFYLYVVTRNKAKLSALREFEKETAREVVKEAAEEVA